MDERNHIDSDFEGRCPDVVKGIFEALLIRWAALHLAIKDILNGKLKGESRSGVCDHDSNSKMIIFKE